MLQNRTFIIVLICLIISQQGQGQGRRNNGLQIRQLPPLPPADAKLLAAERTHKANEMLKYMNLTADACQDFYEYACGNWLKYQNTALVKEGELISVQTQMQANVNKQLQSILNDAVNSQDSTDTKIMKEFYRSCLRVAASSPNQKQFILKFILQHGGSPDIKGSQWQSNYNWLQVIAELKHTYGLDILIRLTIDKANKIYIDEPKTTLLPVELCSSLASQMMEKNEEIFNNIQNEVKDNLRNWFEISESDAKRIAGAIIRFEFDLCKHMRKHHTASILVDEDVEDDPFTRGYNENKMHGELRQNSVGMISFRKLSEKYDIDFKYFVDHSLGSSTVYQVHFRSEDYFEQLNAIAKKGLQASFANYIMYRALAEMNFPTHEHKHQRPFYCVQKVMHYFPQVLGKLYHDKFDRSEIKQDLAAIYEKIKESFYKNLMSAQWMKDNTKRAVKQKLLYTKLNHATTYDMGSVSGGSGMMARGLQLHDNQNYWEKLEIVMKYNANKTIQQFQGINTPLNYIESPSVAIQQQPFTNELIAGLGLLQKPYYSSSYSYSLKYSAVGLALAREMVKILDYEGWHEENPLNQWDSETKNHSLYNIECFRSKISNYFHNNPNVYRNASKLRDVMAETSALNITFNAYLTWLEQPNILREELQLETLPGVNFSNTQLFFINFAQTHCAARHREESVPEFLPLYRHTMEKFDINGPLSNNVEFGRDFGCQLGTDMNVHDKCLSY